MEAVSVYTYKNCQTCKNALKYLDSLKIPYQNLAIDTEVPSPTELLLFLQGVDKNIKKLFNTSGKVYREGNFAAKLPFLSQDAALNLLAENGMLIKRPLLRVGKNHTAVGFKKEEWSKLLQSHKLSQASPT